MEFNSAQPANPKEDPEHAWDPNQRLAKSPGHGPIFEAASQEKNWGVFGIEQVPGKKPRKIPVDPDRGLAIDRQKSAVLDRHDAVSAIEMLDGMQGGDWVLGYLPRAGSAMVGGDLDHCWPEPGRRLLQSHTGFAAITPSGKGIRLLARRPPNSDWNRERERIGFFGSPSIMFTVPIQCLPEHDTVEPVSRLMREMMKRLSAPAQSQGRTPTPSAYAWFHHLTETDQIACAAEMVLPLPSAWRRDYEDWLRVGLCLKRGGEHLFLVWDAWSREAGTGVYGGTREKWSEGMKMPTGGRALTMGTLVMWAKKHGWPGAGAWRKHAFRKIRAG